MLNGKELRQRALTVLKGKYHEQLVKRVNAAVDDGNLEITFNWDSSEDKNLANFVELFQDDETIFGDNIEIKRNEKGMTISW